MSYYDDDEYRGWGSYKGQGSYKDPDLDYSGLNDAYTWHEQMMLDRQWEERMRDQEFLNTSGFDSVIYEDEINTSITEELNQSQQEIKKIEEEIGMIAEIFQIFGKIVYEQGESLDHISNNIETVEENTGKAEQELKKATKYNKSKLVIARDLALVIGGGIVGLGGFFLGPVVGAGTVVAGMGAGGAAVAGIHKIEKRKKSLESDGTQDGNDRNNRVTQEECEL